MPLRISTNVASIAAQRQLDMSQRRTEHSLKALSSGSRIVNAGDDAAGLAISENLRGQLSGIRQARANAENAVSLIQVAEGGLNEQNNILIRLRELGIQAASDTVSDREREYLNEEFSSLNEELDRIAVTTKFGNKQLLQGSGEVFEFQVGPGSGPENVVTYTLDSDSSASTLGTAGLSISDQDDARDSLENIDQALDKVSAIRANFGAFQSRFQAAGSNLDIQYENVAAARSRIYDVDVAHESAELSAAAVTQDAGIAVLAQANQLPQRAARLISQI
jgi:flagellin